MKWLLFAHSLRNSNQLCMQCLFDWPSYQIDDAQHKTAKLYVCRRSLYCICKMQNNNSKKHTKTKRAKNVKSLSDSQARARARERERPKNRPTPRANPWCNLSRHLDLLSRQSNYSRHCDRSDGWKQRKLYCALSWFQFLHSLPVPEATGHRLPKHNYRAAVRSKVKISLQTRHFSHIIFPLATQLSLSLIFHTAYIPFAFHSSRAFPHIFEIRHPFLHDVRTLGVCVYARTIHAIHVEKWKRFVHDIPYLFMFTVQ